MPNNKNVWHIKCEVVVKQNAHITYHLEYKEQNLLEVLIRKFAPI